METVSKNSQDLSWLPMKSFDNMKFAKICENPRESAIASLIALHMSENPARDMYV